MRSPVYRYIRSHPSVIVIVVELRFRSINGIETPSSDL